jgi:hypothetical protein
MKSTKAHFFLARHRNFVAGAWWMRSLASRPERKKEARAKIKSLTTADKHGREILDFPTQVSLAVVVVPP